MTRFSQVPVASHPLPFGLIVLILFIPNESGFHLPVSRSLGVRADRERARAETYP
jgi:hypothetical protein